MEIHNFQTEKETQGDVKHDLKFMKLIFGKSKLKVGMNANGSLSKPERTQSCSAQESDEEEEEGGGGGKRDKKEEEEEAEGEKEEDSGAENSSLQ